MIQPNPSDQYPNLNEKVKEFMSRLLLLIEKEENKTATEKELAELEKIMEVGRKLKK